MVLVEGGTFMMGHGEIHWSNESSPREVTLSDFYIGKYPVTQKEWYNVMGYNLSKFKGDDLPITNINWYDVQEFLAMINRKTGEKYRLPTEAEWEYAARGGIKSQGFIFAGSDNLDKVAWYADNCKSTTHPVGKKKPNELKLYDMSGNVSEWCWDWYHNHNYGKTETALTNPKGPSIVKGGKYIVHRGGGWNDGGYHCTVYERSLRNPNEDDFNLGFRLAL